MKRHIILAIYFIFWILAVVSILIDYVPCAIAAEVHVYSGGSIQETINGASDGDVIIVHQGIYVENIDFLGMAITVRSTNPNDLEIVHSTVIDGNSSGNAVIFSNEEGTDSILSGITVRNGRADYDTDFIGNYPYLVGGGIYCSSSSPTISNCIITANKGNGIYCDLSSPIIANCIISDNMFRYSGVAAIYCVSSSPTIINCSINGNVWSGIYSSSSSPTIINCTIFGNMSHGICFNSSPSAMIKNCTISSNAGNGIYCYSSSPTITNCILWNNSQQEISISQSGYDGSSSPTVTYSDIEQDTGIYPGEGNINVDPLFLEREADNFYLMPNSPCIDTGTSNNAPSEDKEGIIRPQGSGIDMGAYEYVGPASCTPRALFTANQTSGTDSLMVEFDASSSGGSQYSGAIFLWDFGDGTSGNGLKVSHTYTDYGSHNVSLTITTGCGSHSLTLSDLIRIKSSQVTKEVGDGFAYTSIQEAIDDADYGEMILVHDGTYIGNINFKGKGLTVFSENGAASTIIYGSGINISYPQYTIYSSGSVVTFDHRENIDSVLDGFSIKNQYYRYTTGVIYCYFSSPVITNCTISGNMRTGIYCFSSSPMITNCTIIDNIGSGISCQSMSSPKISNCTISRNKSEGYGGGIECENSSPTIINCILWNNSPKEISKYGDGSLTITYSNIQKKIGVYPGVGNINADPLFVGSEAENYYLTSNSPCIDTGTSASAPSEDKEGIVRPQGSGIDMGAYEYVGPASCTPRALFTANQTSGTDFLTVEFDASSSGGSQYSGAVFSWDFGDGTSGSGLKVSHTYTDYGSHNVSLTISTECGSHRLTFSDFIKVKSSQVTKEVGDGFAYTSIQTAIDDADYGEMILVHDGTYIENINFKGKGLTVFSENGAASTIIDGADNGSVAIFNNREGRDSVLEGFTLQNGSAFNGAGICCRFSSPMIINCTIRGNSASGSSYSYYGSSYGYYGYDYSGGGIHCSSSSPVITNCTISGNTAGAGGGIYCSSSSPTITNCNVSNNMGGYGGAIYSYESSLSITNCTISGNTAGSLGGIYCDESSTTITNCILWNNLPQEISGDNFTITYSDIKQDTDIYPGEGNINADPLFVGSKAENHYLTSNSPCIDTGTSTNAPSEDKEGIVRPQGFGIDMGAYEYVKPSYCNPRASFTANRTTGTDSLTVEFDASSSDGSQYSGAVFSWDFGDGTSGNGLTVSHAYTDHGSYNVSLTITTECGSHSLRLYDLIKIRSSQVTREVGEGFPYTSIQEAIDDADYGEMILVHDGTYIENINFKGKVLTVFSENGAASTIIKVSGYGSTVTFDHFEGINSILDGFTIKNDSIFSSVGIYCFSSSPAITNCIIRSNTGQGISCSSSSPRIINCTIGDNMGGGIYCNESSSPIITNCIVSGNMGYGILCNDKSSPIITNCTISDNIGGGFYCDDDSLPTITNCILWNNLPDEFSHYANPTVTYSNIRQENGVYPGEGNISADPLFVESEKGNYYLMPNSPCIDVGTSMSAPSNDKEGIIRPQGSGIDMGAYEYVGPASCTPRASFTANQTMGTGSLTVEFDASSSAGSQYDGFVFSWDFGDGTSGSDLTVSHTYTDYGSYDVSLSITTECGSHILRLYDFIKIGSSQATREVGEGYAYTSIQAAIDDADSGEMILVHDGTYSEGINFKGKGITVRSENGPDLTIMDGGASGRIVSFDHGENKDSVLDGFTIQNGSDSCYGVIYCSYSSPTIINCIIEDNTGSGIYCYDSSPIITNCTIKGNSGNGIECNSSSPRIINCIIINNMDAGIYFFAGSPMITNCTIIGNIGSGIYCSYCSSLTTIVNCILWNNSPKEISGSAPTVTYSDIQQDTGIYPGEGNINADPIFVGSEAGNYYLMPNSPCIDTGTSTSAPSEDKEGIIRPQGSGIDMGAYEYVETASCTPRASFTASQNTGIDPLTVEFDASFSGGSQYSGAIFSWDLGDGTSGSGLKVSHTYTDYGSYDVGLTITTYCGTHTLKLDNLIKIKSSQVNKEVGEGYAYNTIQDAINDADYGEMILVHDGTYIENINFNGKVVTVRSENGANTTIIDGSGSVVTFNHYEGRDSVLDGFTIHTTSYGCGIYCYYSSPSITNCIINGDLANDSRGIDCYSSSPLISNCIISNNRCEDPGGGIHCSNNSSPTIINCSIIENKADSGGGIFCYFSWPTITNCIITGNMAKNKGGAISCSGPSSPSISNCIISDNIAMYIDGGISCHETSFPSVTNCIFWNNSPKGISSGNPTITYSNIQQDTGIYPGEGNINADPLFAGSKAGNYYLKHNSPCIDTGTSTNAPSEDKEGIIRPQDYGIDMGAYEYVGPASCTPRASFTVNQTTGTDSLMVEFDASSSGGSQYSGAILSWDFGDGTSGSGLMVSHAYTDHGSHNVSLTITTDCGAHTLKLNNLIRIKSSQATKEVGSGYAYNTIQEAINDAIYGEIILVHDGTYIENINFRGKMVVVSSENGAATTIIDGNASGSVVTFDHGENKDSVLNGFSIQNGATYDGGGIYCYRSSPTITNCTINKNTSKGDGGGIYCYRSSPTITNCTINNNKAEHSGGGIYCNHYSSPTITNCIIIGNMASKGAGINCGSLSPPTIINCTISKNIAGYDGSSIYCDFSSSATITNCILWDNSPEEISGSTPKVTCSDIKQDAGVHPGVGNINADPLFVGSKFGNCYLMPNSPCIDSGTSTNAPSEDKEGIARPQGYGIDMGAYEYVGPDSCIPRASFTANQTTGSDSLTVEFDASSSGSSQYREAIFSWDFGDGKYGSGLRVYHNYTDYGSYDVGLTITTECGSHWLTLYDLIRIKSSQVTKEVGEGYTYTSIQEAIDDTGYGEMVLVHDGYYFENINFKGKAITVFSENGAATTIIDGDENGSVVTFDHYEGTDSVLEGFTLQNGLEYEGGGILCQNSYPVISNCRILQNRAYSNGGGIYCYNAMPVIIKCLLLGNTVEEMSNQIDIEYDLATYNDIHILNCAEDNRIHIQRYNLFTGKWKSYYRFFGKLCGTAIPLQGDESLYISFFPKLQTYNN